MDSLINAQRDFLFSLESEIDWMNQEKYPSRIARLLFERFQRQAHEDPPLTLREFRGRMQHISRLTVSIEDESVGFRFPSDLTDSTVHLHAGILSSRYATKEGKGEIDKPVSMTREMLLYCFEARPRPISFGITGYSSSDFISYLYHDVAKREMDKDEREWLEDLDLSDQIDRVTEWLREPISNYRNSARRHIRRRMRLLLDRKVVQIGAMQFDREVRTDVMHLFFKLMECDGDADFTAGQIRDNVAIRDDINLLGMYCTYVHFKNDEDRLKEFLRVRCPSLVSDFANETIDLPRRRKGAKYKKRTTETA